MLLHRYHTLDFIKQQGLIEFILFVNKAREKEQEEKAYQQWCAMLPPLNKYMGFHEFYDAISGRNIDMRPAEEIIEEIETLHQTEGRKDGT